MNTVPGLNIILCAFLSLTLLSPAQAQANQSSAPSDIHVDINSRCRIPFEVLKDLKTGETFSLSSAYNSNDSLNANLRQRYLVADLNSTDQNGNCRGVEEYFSPLSELPEFSRLRRIAVSRGVEVESLAKESLDHLLTYPPNAGDAAEIGRELEDLQNYLQQVQRFKSEPVVKQPVHNGYCIGQTLNLCEIVEGQPKLIYRFVTSSSRSTPPPNLYYAPINYIQSRNWSSDRRYTPADARRDSRMGGGSSHLVPFGNGGRPIEMPNFLHYLPEQGYVGETANGIHQIAGGLDSGGTFGAPVSLGCIRLNKFQAKLARWWTPTNAKFFIYYEPNQYRTYGIAATGKARGFKPVRVPGAELAANVNGNVTLQQPSPKRSSSIQRKENDLTFKIFTSNFSPL